MALNILHLSDLHITEKHFYDQQHVLNKLFLDLKSLRDTGQQYDLIFFSGDLIARGDYSEANKEFVRKQFIAPLLEATGLSSDKLFITPGNHDLETSKVPDILMPAFENLNSMKKTNEFIDNLSATPYLTAGFESYNNLITKISTARPVLSTSLFCAYIVVCGGQKVGICCINSAWKATGSPNNGDYGSLQIGQRQIDNLLAAVKECSIRFAILHHPLNWLAPFEHNTIMQELYREFDALFHGHNHSANSLQIAGPQYSTFVSNAGCLYQSREWFNGYSILMFEPKSFWQIKVREYYSDRNQFDVSTRFAKDGESYFHVTVDRSSMDLLKLPSIEYTNAVLDSVNGHLLSSNISEIAPKNLNTLFVSPPLSHLSERQLSEDSNNGARIKYLALDELLATHKFIFFVGQKEMGKTTLLNYICSESNNFLGSELPSFGSYVNIESIKPTVSSLLESIVAFSKGAYRKSEFIELLNQGRMTICFDNLDVSNDKLLSSLEEFVKLYHLNRFYFSVNENFQSSISQRVIPKLGLDASVVYLHSFGRSHTRALISKWFGDSSDVLRDRVDTMLSSLRRLNIPRTPFLISILLWIQERNISFSPVNQAEIIDALIDGILEKLNESKELGRYDSTAKRHFLTELSFAMHTSRTKRFTHNELDSFAVSYFSGRGLLSSSGSFIEELKRKGILIDLGEEVSFKFDCVRAFFLSIRIKESPDLFNYAMTPEGFLLLGEELDYFTGKNRDNNDALIGSLKIVEHFFKGADLNLDLSLFDTIALEESPITDALKDVLQKKIMGVTPLSMEKQEELLDELDAPHSTQSQGEAAATNSVTSFFSSLQTASAILRNSELINDAELKKTSYSKLVYYWCQILLAVIATVELYFDDAEKEAVQEIIAHMPKQMNKYMLKMFIPNSIFVMARESLGTSKLELMIKSNIDESQDTVCKLFSCVLYADLELNDRLNILKTLATQNAPSRFLVELVFFKLMHLYMFRKLSNNESEKIGSMLADIFAQLNKSKNPMQANKLKTTFLAGIARKKLFTPKGH